MAPPGGSLEHQSEAIHLCVYGDFYTMRENEEEIHDVFNRAKAKIKKRPFNDTKADTKTQCCRVTKLQHRAQVAQLRRIHDGHHPSCAM